LCCCGSAHCGLKGADGVTKIKLGRTEVISLVNAMTRFGSSVEHCSRPTEQVGLQVAEPAAAVEGTAAAPETEADEEAANPAAAAAVPAAVSGLGQAEVSEMLRSCGLFRTDAEMAELFGRMDADASGTNMIALAAAMGSLSNPCCSPCVRCSFCRRGGRGGAGVVYEPRDET